MADRLFLDGFYLPYKAVAEVSKIGHYRSGLVFVTPGWQSGATGDWGSESFIVCLCPLFVSVCHSQYLCLSVCLSLCPSISPMIYLLLCFSMSLSVSICLYLSLSVSICLYLSLSVSICLYLSLSVPICLYLSLSVSICPYLSLSVSICLYLSLPVSICLYLSLSVSICLYLSLSVSICPISLSIHPSVSLSVHRSIDPSIHPSIGLSCCPSIYPFIDLSNFSPPHLSIQLSKVAWKSTERFTHFWQGAESIAPAMQHHILTKKWSETVSLTLFDFQMCFAPQQSALFQHLKFQKLFECVVLLPFWLEHVLRATTACTFWTSQLPKLLWGVFNIFTSKYASRLTAVHFLNISTSKSAPYPSIFCTFDFEMCFAPQRRTLFEHLNFQKCSEPEALCAFWLPHVLRATAVCSFSISQLPKVFLISHLTRWLCTGRCSEPTFRPSGATNHWKNTVFRDVSTFSCLWAFFLLTLSLLISSLLTLSLLRLLLPLLFLLSILSENWFLNFLRWRYYVYRDSSRFK